jgi:hypothetical protein
MSKRFCLYFCDHITDFNIIFFCETYICIRHRWQQVPEINVFLEDVVQRAIDVKTTPFVDLGSSDILQECQQIRIRGSH